MARLTNPTGAIVSVSDEKAERLTAQGWTPVEEPKAPAKKAASAKKSSK